MSKKIIITEKQLVVIKKSIDETIAHSRLKNRIQSFLEADYEPSYGVKEMGNEFFSKPLIKKKINGDVITPKALRDYLEHKFTGLSIDELNDSILGWYYGDFDKETGMRKKK